MISILNELKSKILTIRNHPIFEKYSLYLIPGITIISGLIITTFITIPQILKIIETNTQIKDLNIKRAEYKQKISSLEKIDLNQYKTWIDYVLSALPNDKELPEALGVIIQFIASSGLQLNNISIGSSNSDKSTNAILIKLELSGGKDQFKTFIDQSNQSPRLFKINNISLTNSSQTIAQGSVDVLVFYSPLDEKLNIATNEKITPITEKENELLTQLGNNSSIAGQSINPTFTDTPSGKTDPFN